MAGKKPRGFRSPSGELSKATFTLLAEYGFEYDSSQFAADRAYWIEDKGVRTNLVEIPIAVELTDSCHFMFLFQPDDAPADHWASPSDADGGKIHLLYAGA